MSASLVGSEMCIRDRGAEAETAEVARSHICTLFIAQTTTAQTDLMSAAPVSYTHLTLPTICSV
eukprot:966345-Alexandrium_andersonii.AAC.1